MVCCEYEKEEFIRQFFLDRCHTSSIELVSKRELYENHCLSHSRADAKSILLMNLPDSNAPYRTSLPSDI